MAIYTVDVYSNSSDSIIRDSHAQGVIIKATQGNGYVNPMCNHQWDLAGQLGKLRGLYHYAGGGNPENEAQYFINNIRNYVGQGILILDWESYQNASWGNTQWARRFVNEVHRLTGVWCVIYVQESALWQVANCANDCGVWVAKYASMNWNSWTLPNMRVSSGAFGALTGWQFTGGDMDRSIFYLDANAWNRIAKPNASTPVEKQVDGHWYLILPNGQKATGFQKLPDGRIVYYNEQGQLQNGLTKATDGYTYYLSMKDGNMYRGEKQIDGHWYYFLPANGRMATGFQKLPDGRIVYYNDQGQIQNGLTKADDGFTYYLSTENGDMYRGLLSLNGHQYYFLPANGRMATGWQEIDGKKYYFNPSNGQMAMGTQTIDGVEYVFADNGSLQGQKQQPVQPKPKPVKKSTLSDADRQAIENDLKPYIQDVVKQELANNGR